MSSLFGRRHYVWLANTLRDTEPNFELFEQFKELVFSIADALERESPAFRRDKFLHNVLCDPTDHEFDTDECPFNRGAASAA